MRHPIHIGFTVWLLAALSGLAWGYEVETHEEMSQKAVEASILAKDPKLLPDLGLQPLSNKQKFPNSINQDKDIVNLFRDGARFEDNFPRPLNHFFDPLNDRALGSNVKSPDWALEDNSDIADQWYSYKEARDYLYKALTDADDDKRKLYFGLTFQTLGHVIHHVQDMAQPQHVRNDAHCDLDFPCKYPGALIDLYSPSLYEKYTKDLGGNLPFSGYPAVTLDQARSFWTTPDGRGLAQYTNRGFVSAGTNYQLMNDQPVANAAYPEPKPTGFGQPVPVQSLFQERGETTTLTGVMGFVENEVYDRYKNVIARKRT